MQTRTSHSLEQFCASLDDPQEDSSGGERVPKRVLDLAAANQGTITFVAGAGHRLYSDDFLKQLDDCFGQSDFHANQEKPELVAKFLDNTLNFPGHHFDGILVWDSLQFLPAPLLETVMARLRDVLKPGGYMLAIFNAAEQPGAIPTYSFRIVDKKTMGLAPRGERKAAQFFNNRSLERLFEGFDSVKFFLTRDHLREVIVRR